MSLSKLNDTAMLSAGNTGVMSSLLPSTGYGSDTLFSFIDFQFYGMTHIVGKPHTDDSLALVTEGDIR